MPSIVDIFNNMARTARREARLRDIEEQLRNSRYGICVADKEPARIEPIPELRSSIPTNCPNCAAPIDIHAEQCAYCDTPYTYLSRPRYGRYQVGAFKSKEAADRYFDNSEGVRIEIDTSKLGVSVKEAIENIKRMQEHALKFGYNL